MYKIIKLIAFIFFSYISNSNLFGSSIPATGVDKIVILSYNIRIAHLPSKGWNKIDLPAIAKVIKQVNPDLIALQEVDAFTERSGKDVHQAKELARMTDMNYFFAKAVDRVAIMESLFCPAIRYKKSKDIDYRYAIAQKMKYGHLLL